MTLMWLAVSIFGVVLLGSGYYLRRPAWLLYILWGLLAVCAFYLGMTW